MKLLIVAAEDRWTGLAAHFAADFEVHSVADAASALSFLGQHEMDAVVVHLGIGEGQALDVLYGARKLAPERRPGTVVVAEAIEIRGVVEVMRGGAYDVQLEASLPPGKLAHSVRNAVLLARLGRRPTEPAKTPDQ